MGTDRAMTTYPDDVVEKALLAFHNGVMFGSYTQELQDAMRRALASAEAAMWRPIDAETPEGKLLLLEWRPVDYANRPWHREVIIGQVCANDGPDAGKAWANGRHYDIALHITRWRPLPTPPAASTGRG